MWRMTGAAVSPFFLTNKQTTPNQPTKKQTKPKIYVAVCGALGIDRLVSQSASAK